MNLVQQLAEYQNAPIQTLEAAKQGANPAISPWVAGAILSDRLEKQKRMQNAQGAAMGPQPTVAEQQDQEVAGIMQALGDQGAGQAQGAPQEMPVMAAGGGLMQARVNPGMYDYCGGGIIAFDEGGDVDDEVRDPVTGALISGGETRRGENQTVREALGLGNVENRRALEKLEEDQRKENAPKPRPASNLSAGERDKQSEYARLIKAGVPPEMAAQLAGMAPAAKPAPAKPPAPGASSKPSAGGLMDLLIGSAEWADLDAARKKQFEAPNLPTTAGGLSAEREAHLKSQGITKKPWELAAEQTAELRRLTKSEDEERKAERAAREKEERYDTFVANLGAGSFGQSSQGGLRANLKREAENRAEEQRIKELRYNQNLKLNEIDAKAQELRYNEAIGDVAAAQKNRKDIAEMQREFEKNKVAIAQGQAGLRERGLASQLTSDTQLKIARERATAGVGSESKETQMAEAAFARDPEAASIKKQLEGHMSEAKRVAKVRRLREIQAAKYKQFGLTLEEGPVQSQIGPPPKGAVREVKR